MKKSIPFYLISIHLLLILILAKSNFINLVEARFSAKAIDNKDTFHSNIVSFHKRIDQNVTTGIIPFFGDSLVQGLSTSSIAPNIINYGIGNDTVQNLITRLNTYTNSLNNAQFIILSIGVNDLIRLPPSKVIILYQNLIIELRKKTKVLILVNSIFPINESIEYHQRKNKHIKALNRLLINQIVDPYDSIYFIDNFKYFINRNSNQLLVKYHIGDGIHLNKAGNEVWISNIKKALEKL